MYANCQGDELERLLNASSAFSRAFRLVRKTNYIREPIPQEEFDACTVFLYQHLGENWGECASRVLLERLPEKAQAIHIPNLMFKGCWPFWTQKGHMAFGDSFLNRLLDEGAPKKVILRMYLHGDIRAYADLKAALEETIAIEREKERAHGIPVVDFLLAHWRERPLFHTINHPGRELLTRVAQVIMAQLDLPPLSEAEIASIGGRFPSYADFDLPVHPQVAAFHGLTWAGPETEFAVFGKRLTFAQYVSRYIDCRLNGLDDDFTSYLHFI